MARQKKQTASSAPAELDAVSTEAVKESYEVGYQRPPKHSQFKPGQSGNPKGRPVGSLNVNTLLKRAITKKVTVREGEKTRQMPVVELMFQTHTTKAAKGDPRSATFIVNAISKGGLWSEEGTGPVEQQSGADWAEAAAKRPSAELFENIDQTLLSDDEKVELSRLAEIVDFGGGMTALNVHDFARAREIVNKGRGKDITPTSI
jgi:hypothetical protein